MNSMQTKPACDLLQVSRFMYEMLQELVKRAGNDNNLAEHLAMAQISLSVCPQRGQAMAPFGLLDGKDAIERAESDVRREGVVKGDLVLACKSALNRLSELRCFANEEECDESFGDTESLLRMAVARAEIA